jgi:hypothetical protein
MSRRRAPLSSIKRGQAFKFLDVNIRYLALEDAVRIDNGPHAIEDVNVRARITRGATPGQEVTASGDDETIVRLL